MSLRPWALSRMVSPGLAEELKDFSSSKFAISLTRSDRMDARSLPIMIYGVLIVTGGSHATTEFYLHRPTGPPLAALILQDHLKLPDHGPKCWAGPLLTLLFYAAANLTSLSDACQSLPRRPLRRSGPVGLDRHLARLRRVAPPAQRRLGREFAPDLAADRNAWPATWS